MKSASANIIDAATTLAARTRMRRGSSPPAKYSAKPPAFLRLLVRRKPDSEELQGLAVAVAIGEHVGPDLVLNQWLHPILAEGGGGRDKQRAKRHHQIGHVVTHLDRCWEPRIPRSVPLEFVRAASANAVAVTLLDVIGGGLMTSSSERAVAISDAPGTPNNWSVPYLKRDVPRSSNRVSAGRSRHA